MHVDMYLSTSLRFHRKMIVSRFTGEGSTYVDIYLPHRIPGDLLEEAVSAWPFARRIRMYLRMCRRGGAYVYGWLGRDGSAACHYSRPTRGSAHESLIPSRGLRLRH